MTKIQEAYLLLLLIESHGHVDDNSCRRILLASMDRPGRETIRSIVERD